VVNATGPWTDRTMSLSHSGHKNLLRPTKGVHIVVEHDKLPVRHAVVCFHPKDKRVLFAIPWGDRTYLGTTDTDYSGDPGDVVAQATDVEYLLGAAAEYFPEFSLEKEDVISTWAGLRPLISSESQVDESDVSREHRILVGTGGVVTVAGGKLTTYRKMSAEVVDTVLHLLRLKNCLPDDLREARTDAHPLPGAVGWPPDDNHARVSREIYEVADGHLDEATCEMLTNTYGMNGIRVARDVYRNPVLATPLIEGRPEILAQVDWGVKQEMAATVTDILIQRTQVFYRAFDQGLSAAPLVSERMAFLLGWDEETRRRHVDQFTHDVALSQLWRTAT
jgi:glycerol-3-phosphate dehydrogenase